MTWAASMGAECSDCSAGVGGRAGASGAVVVDPVRVVVAGEFTGQLNGCLMHVLRDELPPLREPGDVPEAGLAGHGRVKELVQGVEACPARAAEPAIDAVDAASDRVVRWRVPHAVLRAVDSGAHQS